MVPILVITLREVIEACLIVATLLGLTAHLHQKGQVQSIFVAAISALIVSFVAVALASFFGFSIHPLIDTPVYKGITSVVSALFITWAIFTLHGQFAQQKMHWLSHMQKAASGKGLFAFTFIAVLREGIEIVTFLATLYVTTPPYTMISGFVGGVASGVVISILFFQAIIRVPVYWVFRITSYLLILFAGNMLAQGIGTLLGVFPFHNAASVPAIAALAYIFVIHRRVFVNSR